MPVRYVDAEEEIVAMRERFAHRPVERSVTYDFDFPPQMRAVGDSLAVEYQSDKWKDFGPNGRRPTELWKHLAESRNRVLALPGVICDPDLNKWPTIGPLVSLDGAPITRQQAYIGLLEGLCLKLHTAGSNARPEFGKHEDDGVIHLRVKHAHVSGILIKWARRVAKPALVVYTAHDGVMFLIVGEELAIERDGIVG